MQEHIASKIEYLYSLTAKQLMREYKRITGEDYYTNNRKSLIRKIAWLYQTKDTKSISQVAKDRVNELVKNSKLRLYPPRDYELEIPNHILKRNNELLPGSILSKTYNGKHYEVVVMERGFLWNNTIYKSISGVAKAITGTHWNGKLFFGLK